MVTPNQKSHYLGFICNVVCCQCLNYFYLAWIPVYLQEGRNFSEGAMKMITSAVFIGGLLGGSVSGFISDWLVTKKGLRVR
jgi:ACS family glucarate transporter-like MFS transporter